MHGLTYQIVLPQGYWDSGRPPWTILSDSQGTVSEDWSDESSLNGGLYHIRKSELIGFPTLHGYLVAISISHVRHRPFAECSLCWVPLDPRLIPLYNCLETYEESTKMTFDSSQTGSDFVSNRSTVKSTLVLGERWMWTGRILEHLCHRNYYINRISHSAALRNFGASCQHLVHATRRSSIRFPMYEVFRLADQSTAGPTVLNLKQNTTLPPQSTDTTRPAQNISSFSFTNSFHVLSSHVVSATYTSLSAPSPAREGTATVDSPAASLARLPGIVPIGEDGFGKLLVRWWRCRHPFVLAGIDS
jgi:hypothetical protein